MRPVTWAMATAVTGSALLWAGIVTRLTMQHELATTVLFSALMPFLAVSAIFSATAAVGMSKPPESRHQNEQLNEGETPG